MADSVSIFDVVIAGGGASGLALAAAIKQALGAGAAIAVVDPAPAPSRETGSAPLRTVAIAEGPRRLLERIGAWETLAPKTQAILSMAIMDGGVRDAVRLPHLNFAGAEGEPLAHMAFNDDVVSALVGALRPPRRQAHQRRRGALEPRQARGRARTVRRPHLARPPRRRGRRRTLEAKRLRRRSRRSAGTTTRPASSPPSPTNAITTGARSSISCPPVRSRSCPCLDGARASSGTSGAPTRGPCLRSSPRI